MSKKITMRAVFAALCHELGAHEGARIFEWYCANYGVTIADDAPAVVAWEVFGI